MKTIFFTIALLIAGVVQAMDMTCDTQVGSSYAVSGTVLKFSNIGVVGQPKLKILKGKLKYELASINMNLTLLSQGTSKKTGWKTAVLETDNDDDTNFIITITSDEELGLARASIAVLVDRLEGGMASVPLECNLTK